MSEATQTHTNADLLPPTIREAIEEVLNHYRGEEQESWESDAGPLGDHVYGRIRQLDRWLAQPPAKRPRPFSDHSPNVLLRNTELDPQELACVLVGLRFLQRAVEASGVHRVAKGWEQFDDEGLVPLDAEELDELCMTINLGGYCDVTKLLAVVEERGWSDDDVRHLLRVALEAGVDNRMELNEALHRLVRRLGFFQANVLLGHAQEILAHYDQIRLDGYDLGDAIQDFVDGRVRSTPHTPVA